MGHRSRSKDYHRIKHYVFFAGLFLDLAVLLIVFFSGLTFDIKELAQAYSVHPWAVNVTYVVILSVGVYLIHFPLSVFEGFIWEHRFGLSNQTFGSWLKDDLKKAAIGLALLIMLVEVAYLLLGAFERSWWIWAGCFWLAVTFILAKLTPHVIVPLFYKYSKVDDEELRSKIFGLFKKCQVSLKDVYAIDLSSKSKKANAFLCGLGGNRRVVLSDTLLSNFSNDEIETVVAHELAHYKHQDILKLLTANACLIFTGFYLIDRFLKDAVVRFGMQRIDDIALLPLLAVLLIVFGFTVNPILNAYSRRIEARADRFSLEKTGKREEFISMMRKLGDMNLAEWAPGRWTELLFYDHPPVSKRIKFAENFSFPK